MTYRLAGTLPANVVAELKAKKELMLRRNSTVDHKVDTKHFNRTFFAAYEHHLDVVSKIDWLQDPKIASMLRENLYHFAGQKYSLHAYCIMPNHVHVLLTPHQPPNEHHPVDFSKADQISNVGEVADKCSPLSNITHSLKSYTANRANRMLNRSGTFWQPESYDHWVRNDDELERIVNYIRANPVKAGLVEHHQDWYWSSCHDRFLIDGDTSGWLPQPT
ncbi:MAG: transposase [Pirellulaceae bacterium]